MSVKEHRALSSITLKNKVYRFDPPLDVEISDSGMWLGEWTAYNELTRCSGRGGSADAAFSHLEDMIKERLAGALSEKRIGWFDMCVYRLFYRRWQPILKARKDLRKLFIEHLQAFDFDEDVESLIQFKTERSDDNV